MSEVNFYSNVFKNWPVALRGAKPTADQLATAHKIGCRPGKQALAIAMSLRDAGVTNSQIVSACGNPQLNKMRGFVSDAILRKLNVPPSSEGHTVYKLEVTPKGAQLIKRNEARAAKLEVEGKADEKPAPKPKGPTKAKAKAHIKAAKAKGNAAHMQAIADVAVAEFNGTTIDEGHTANTMPEQPQA